MSEKGSEVSVAERRTEAMRLRSLGCSYRQIGKQLGVDGSTAYRLVQSGLEVVGRRLEKYTRRYVAQELLRLEVPLLPLAPKVQAGDPEAIRLWADLSEKRLRLIQPKRKEIQVTGADGGPVALRTEVAMSPDELQAKLGRLSVEELRQLLTIQRRFNGELPPAGAPPLNGVAAQPPPQD